MKIDGTCHCGFIRFEAEVDPEKASVCHCTDCQQLSGSPFRVSVPAERADFRLLSGEPAVYVKVADSGRRRAQAFCPRCGSPIYATSAEDDAAPLNIRAGVLAQRGELEPRRQIWRNSSLGWSEDISGLPSSPEQ